MDKLKFLIDSEKIKIKKLLKNQNNFKAKDGYFVYELEADVTIPSEYILLMHFLGKLWTQTRRHSPGATIRPFLGCIAC